MRAISIIIALAAISGASGAGASSAAGDAPKYALVSHNLCTTPPGWAKPFTHVYHMRTGATLVFIGVEHSADLADETHRQIRDGFDAYKPDLALVEGVSSTKSAFDWYRRDIAALAGRDAEAGSVPENLYAALLATQHGAKFSGWDFSPDQDYAAILADKFDIHDALGAHLLRSRVNPFGGETSANEVERQIRYASMAGSVGSFDYADWYRRTYGDTFDPVNGTPCGKGVGSVVVNDLSYRRNLNLTALIEKNATAGHTILVEAGANHWLALKDWLSSSSTSWR